MRATHSACLLVDEVLYRPAVVKLAERFPRWWTCELARLSMWLDDRWETGFWGSRHGPPDLDGPCEACGRRAAWLVVWDWDDEDWGGVPPEGFNIRWPVQLCGWCKLDGQGFPASEEELDRALQRARHRSVSWRWRWDFEGLSGGAVPPPPRGT